MISAHTPTRSLNRIKFCFISSKLANLHIVSSLFILLYNLIIFKDRHEPPLANSSSTKMSLSTVLLTDRPGKCSIYCFVIVLSYIPGANGAQPNEWRRDAVLDLAPLHGSTVNAGDAFTAIKVYHDRLWAFGRSIAADFRGHVQNAQGQDLEDWMKVSVNTGGSMPISLTGPPSSEGHDWLSFQSVMNPLLWAPPLAELAQPGVQTPFAGIVLVVISFGGLGREAPAGATLGPDGPAQVTLPQVLHVPFDDDAMFFSRFGEENEEEVNAITQIWFSN